MSEQPIRIGYCLSLTGRLVSAGATARLLDDAKLAQFTPDPRRHCQKLNRQQGAVS
jgi:hypothetical protein